MCTSNCTYYPTRLAAVPAQRGGSTGFAPAAGPPLQAFKISGVVKITFPLRLEVFQLWVPFWMLCCSPKCHQSGNVENVGGPGRENGNYCWMADWLLAAWNLPRFGNIFGAFLRYFGVTGHHFGTTEHHFGITGHHFAPGGANVSILWHFWEIP